MYDPPAIPNTQTLTVITIGGCIHAFLEGYYVYNFRHMPSMQDLFGQLWKEYSLSDSRYQTQNAFVLCMEAVTSIFWGPLSFILAGMIMLKHPMRHPLQVVISLGQFYGNVLYYGTSLFDHYILDLSYSRPEPAVFWGYFVFCNAFWVVIPLSECSWTEPSTSLLMLSSPSLLKPVDYYEGFCYSIGVQAGKDGL